MFAFERSIEVDGSWDGVGIKVLVDGTLKDQMLVCLALRDLFTGRSL